MCHKVYLLTLRFISFQDNRWKKKALAIVPLKWGVNTSFTKYTVLVNIQSDGTVLVHHGGVEMGQGINTKVK